MSQAPAHCPHAGECPGCPLIGEPYAQQLTHKRRRVEQALGRYAVLRAVEVPAVLGAEPSFGYRTRAKLVVGEAGELGLYAAGTHRVVDIPECGVLVPAVARVVGALREIVREDARGVTAIDVRELRADAQAQAIVTWIGRFDEARRQQLVERARRIPGVAGVAVAASDPRGVRVLGAVPEPAHGDALFADRLQPGEPYALVAHGSFVQSHRGQAARMARRVIDVLEPVAQARVLELFGGSGHLALSLAARGAEVTWVESYAPAARACARAAGRQGLGDRLHVRRGDASEVLAELVAEGAARFEAALVNPPRRGLVPELRARLSQLGLRRLLYVSCDPDTLARDLAAFATLGLRVHALLPFDMIAQSSAVEVLALLEPGSPPPLEVLYQDDEVLVLDKPPHQPTTPHPERAGSVLEQAALEHGLSREALSAVHRLDVGTSGICILARRRADVRSWAVALAAGQKRYVALVRGVTHKKGKVARPLQERGRTLVAATRYVRTRVVGGHSLLEVSPEQGRTHQVRRHLSSLGHPVLGDARYGHGPSNRHLDNRWGLDRTFLHLQRVELRHPRTGETLVLDAPLAGDLQAVLDGMSGEGVDEAQPGSAANQASPRRRR